MIKRVLKRSIRLNTKIDINFSNSFITHKMIMNNKELQEQVKQNEEKFNKFFDRFHKENIEKVDNQLSLEEKERMDFIIETMLIMSEDEKKYFRYLVLEKFNNIFGMDIMSLKFNLPIFSNEMTSSPSDFVNNNWKEQIQQLQNGEQLQGRSFMEIFEIQMGQQQKQQVDEKQDKKEEKKEEAKVIKTNFDLELVSIDAAQKIKIIKEVRTLCGLGLKEAKDMVEKLPSVLFKQAIMEDIEKYQAILIPLGCVFNLK